MDALNRRSTSNIFTERLRAMILNMLRRLISAAPGDDPVELLKTAAATYVPVNQAIATPEVEETVSQSRPSIDEVISAIQGSSWYKDQVIHRRTVPPKAAQTGQHYLHFEASLPYSLRFIGPVHFQTNFRCPFTNSQYKRCVFAPSLCYQRNTIRQKCRCFDQHRIWQKCDLPGTLSSFFHVGLASTRCYRFLYFSF